MSTSANLFAHLDDEIDAAWVAMELSAGRVPPIHRRLTRAEVRAIDGRVRSIAQDYHQECERWREGLRATWERDREEERQYWLRQGLRENEARERAAANSAQRAAARQRFAEWRAGRWRRTLPNGPTPHEIVKELLFGLESHIALQLVQLGTALSVEAFRAAVEAAREHNKLNPPVALPAEDDDDGPKDRLPSTREPTKKPPGGGGRG